MATRAMMALAVGVGVAMGAAGCDETGKVDDTTVKVEIGGKSFTLELALDDKSRFQGLSGRTEIKADGGMMFVFPDRGVQVHQFVMRDCPVPIDIIFLDKLGRITATHEMQAEAPRSEEEKKNSPPVDPLGRAIPNVPEWAWTNAAYEARLKKYSSRFPAQFAIELRGGTIKPMELKEGQKIEFDRAALVKRAR